MRESKNSSHLNLHLIASTRAAPDKGEIYFIYMVIYCRKEVFIISTTYLVYFSFAFNFFFFLMFFFCFFFFYFFNNNGENQ